MLRWFSIRRILVWATLASLVLVVLVGMGKWFAKPYRRHDGIRAARKARLRFGGGRHIGGVGRGGGGEGREEKSQSSTNMAPQKLVVPPRREMPLEQAYITPFQMHHDDIKVAFEQFKKGNETMEVHLWRMYRVMALPVTKGVQPRVRFTLSIQRHVALFYGEYLMRGGTEPRHFGIPVCRTIGLGEGSEEYRTKELQKLVGSQGDLLFREVPYSQDGIRAPFRLNGKDGVQLVVKYFSVNRKDDDRHAPPPTDEEAIREREAKDLETSKKIFGREHNALTTVAHRGIIQPVCFEKEPKLRMIYPFLSGGDLVTLSTDQIAFVDPIHGRLLNPDQTFLPRFFRQLVEAVYALHQAGLLHFDLKPENMVVSGPDRNFILPADSTTLMDYSLVLLDFGLAMRLVDAEKRECIRAGTDVTMAPEQHICKPAGRGTDWWAVAASMWRTRIFWEPTLTDDERDTLVNSKCPQWGHYSYPAQSFFDPAFTNLMEMMLVPRKEDRDFSKDARSIRRLLDSPYLLRGLPVEERKRRMEELSRMPPLEDTLDSNDTVYSDSHYSI